MTIFTTPPTAREVGKERDLNGLAYSGVSAQGFEQFEITLWPAFFVQPLHQEPRLTIWALRGWRGQAPRQPGQIRKEAAVTSPAWVVVSLSPLPP